MSLCAETFLVVLPIVLPDHLQKSSAGAGATAHVRRVSAWAAQIGKNCGLGAGSVDLLRKAALLHHGPGFGWSGSSLQRLMTELNLDVALPMAGRTLAMWSNPQWALLFRERGLARVDSHPLGLMCRIAEIAHAFDELLESLPYAETPRRDILAELSALFPDSESAAILSQIPGRNPLLQQDIATIVRRLPISQASAANLWCLASDDDPQVRVLEELTSRDAVLACLLVRAANVAEFPLRTPITTVRKAILHIGIPKARKILVAALLRPAFGVGVQKSLWNHSLDAVQAGEAVCDLCGLSQREEIFLASLVHDIGRSALLVGNNPRTHLYGELIGEVAEVNAVEHFLFGQDHGAIGAAILEEWRFPEKLREAVRNHHQPEVSDDLLTHALHLVEFITGSEEDIPSLGRLADSARVLGVSIPDLLRCTVEQASSWNVLRYAA